MKTCERAITYDLICGKRAAWVHPVNIVEWRDGGPKGVIGQRGEYLCDEHAAWHKKMGHTVKKLQILNVNR